MSDDQNKQQDQPNQHIDASVPERPLDPTRNAQDMFGDTAGMTGVTQGGLQQSSAEPSDRLRDTTEIHGGVIQNPTIPSPTGYSKSEVSNDQYKQAVQQGMSNEARAAATDTATEPSSTDQAGGKTSLETTPQDVELTKGGENEKLDQSRAEVLQTGVSPDFGKQLPTKDVEPGDAPYMQPENTGEEEMSGTAPDPRSDDDTLQAAQQVGMQVGEDPEHPEPVDIARDVDDAEQAIKKE